ncbi:DUF5367 family protein [Paenibacillus sp. JCM 10914]|uniref:DUF5367 family protein n=1 Tax=Paenibacillus sp. JCM 10914 TaxID=1236974 RepID=UPI00055B4061|nr:DUF5367 family protein [Paenibacillus sp. JCM 10914]
MKISLTERQRIVYSLLWGFLLWLVATLIFHFWGNWLIDVRNIWRTAISFIIAVPLIYGCVTFLFSLLDVPTSERSRLSIFIALPGMLLDIFSLLFHSVVFSVISEQSIPVLAAWLFWAYGLIFVTGLKPVVDTTK